MDYRLKAETGYINFSPVGFRLAAADFLRGGIALRTNTFSIVPYFMCCRAIELGFKAIHLERLSQAEARDQFWHELRKSYDALPIECRILDQAETNLLTLVTECYSQKAFEYVQPIDAATAYSRFPDLDQLIELTDKIVALALSRPQ